MSDYFNTIVFLVPTPKDSNYPADNIEMVPYEIDRAQASAWPHLFLRSAFDGHLPDPKLPSIRFIGNDYAAVKVVETTKDTITVELADTHCCVLDNLIKKTTAVRLAENKMPYFDMPWITGLTFGLVRRSNKEEDKFRFVAFDAKDENDSYRRIHNWLANRGNGCGFPSTTDDLLVTRVLENDEDIEATDNGMMQMAYANYNHDFDPYKIVNRPSLIFGINSYHSATVPTWYIAGRKGSESNSAIRNYDLNFCSDVVSATVGSRNGVDDLLRRLRYRILVIDAYVQQINTMIRGNKDSVFLTPVDREDLLRRMALLMIPSFNALRAAHKLILMDHESDAPAKHKKLEHLHGFWQAINTRLIDHVNKSLVRSKQGNSDTQKTREIIRNLERNDASDFFNADHFMAGYEVYQVGNMLSFVSRVIVDALDFD